MEYPAGASLKVRKTWLSGMSPVAALLASAADCVVAAAPPPPPPLDFLDEPHAATVTARAKTSTATDAFPNRITGLMVAKRSENFLNARARSLNARGHSGTFHASHLKSMA